MNIKFSLSPIYQNKCKPLEEKSGDLSTPEEKKQKIVQFSDGTQAVINAAFSEQSGILNDLIQRDVFSEKDATTLSLEGAPADILSAINDNAITILNEDKTVSYGFKPIDIKKERIEEWIHTADFYALPNLSGNILMHFEKTRANDNLYQSIIDSLNVKLEGKYKDPLLKDLIAAFSSPFFNEKQKLLNWVINKAKDFPQAEFNKLIEKLVTPPYKDAFTVNEEMLVNSFNEFYESDYDCCRNFYKLSSPPLVEWCFDRLYKDIQKHDQWNPEGDIFYGYPLDFLSKDPDGKILGINDKYNKDVWKSRVIGQAIGQREGNDKGIKQLIDWLKYFNYSIEHLDFNCNSSMIMPSDEELGLILKAFPTIRKVTIGAADNLTTKFGLVLGPKIEEITIRSALFKKGFCSECLQHIPPTIKSRHIGFIRGSEKIIDTEPVLSEFVGAYDYIDLTFKNLELNDAIWEEIKKCSGLQTLTFENCTGYTLNEEALSSLNLRFFKETKS